MTVYVDDETEYPAGTVNGVTRVRYWCHMWADTLDELHNMAIAIGMRREWFQGPPKHSLAHYDLSRSRREQAIRRGARVVEIDKSHLLLMRELAEAANDT